MTEPVVVRQDGQMWTITANANTTTLTTTANGGHSSVTRPGPTRRMHKLFVGLAHRVQQGLCIPPAAHSTPQQREKKMANDTPERTRTLTEMRVLAAEQAVEQIERFDDPRLIDLVVKMHVYAADKDWCAEFDRLAVGMGIPARPKKDYFTIERVGVFDFNGQAFDVTAKVDVYGEVDGDGVGIESSGIAEYQDRYGKSFDEAVAEQWQKQALAQMVSTFTFAAKDDQAKVIAA